MYVHIVLMKMFTESACLEQKSKLNSFQGRNKIALKWPSSFRLQDFNIPVALTTELRSYQRAGVSWLAFLNRYKLHGVLCDDMGLGKTD